MELDGDTTQNLEAFEKIVRVMKESGIGYGSINHPVDRDPVCGYNGIIGDTCPNCGRREEDQPFERIRRITPDTWWARSTASTTQSAPRNGTASSTAFEPGEMGCPRGARAAQANAGFIRYNDMPPPCGTAKLPHAEGAALCT